MALERETEHSLNSGREYDAPLVQVPAARIWVTVEIALFSDFGVGHARARSFTSTGSFRDSGLRFQHDPAEGDRYRASPQHGG